MTRVVFQAALFALCLCSLLPSAALADGGVCPRPAAQSEVLPPPDIYSTNGAINVQLNYLTSVDDLGRTLFCFVTADGVESPTLHVNPGDTINITLTNMIQNIPGAPSETMFTPDAACGSTTMTATSVNMHFHGTNTSPRCHSDDVMSCLANFIFSSSSPF